MCAHAPLPAIILSKLNHCGCSRNKAVSNGAVSFYIDGSVSSRVSRATYGTEVYHLYDSTKPSHIKRGSKIQVHPDHGKPVLYDGFSVILCKVCHAFVSLTYR